MLLFIPSVIHYRGHEGRWHILPDVNHHFICLAIWITSWSVCCGCFSWTKHWPNVQSTYYLHNLSIHGVSNIFPLPWSWPWRCDLVLVPVQVQSQGITSIGLLVSDSKNNTINIYQLFKTSDVWPETRKIWHLPLLWVCEFHNWLRPWPSEC